MTDNMKTELIFTARSTYEFGRIVDTLEKRGYEVGTRNLEIKVVTMVNDAAPVVFMVQKIIAEMAKEDA